ncbi:MAG: hypothetical protein BroJett029_03870 [Alphaproteobacteria bacterium]|nr:MAG: hypothetical protein BroJett029_03870 [Alphaproteobacteria bacterium]
MAGCAFRRLAGLAACPGLLLLASGAAGQVGSEPSRDARSATYCSQRANIGGYYDTEAALACRREEYTAAARARALDTPRDLDEYCESMASEGSAVGPFSWRAFVECLDGVLP